MKKYFLPVIALLLLGSLFLPGLAQADIPTARIDSYADGTSVCSYSASTTAANLTLTVSTTGVPTNIEYSYRLQGESTWTVLGSTGTAAPYPLAWDISSLTNGGVYEARAVASNSSGTDPSPGLIWLKINQNPQVAAVAYSTTNVVNSKTYIKAGNQDITAWFTNVFNAFRKMDTSVTPNITITPKGKTAITGTDTVWSATGVSSDTVKQTFAITDTTGDGEAIVTISGGKDVNGFTQDSLSTQLIIDTVKPTVSSIQVDEDGDGSFTDNVGYIGNGQTPRFYVTFSERIYDIAYASYTPTGKTPILLAGPFWVDAPTNTMCFFTPTAAINATTGDGLTGIVIGTIRDNALNSNDHTAIDLAVIDGNAPKVPIITAPANNIAVNEGSIVEVKLQTPTDTDIKYAAFTDGTNVYWDFTAPYQCPMPIAAGVTTLTVTYVDRAGNTSAAEAINITTNPMADITVPHALIRTITTTIWPTRIDLRAYVNDTETNIKKVEFQYSTDNVTWTTIGTDAKNDDNFIIPWNVTTLATGAYYLRAIATDLAGNVDPSPSAINIWISKEATTVDIVESAAKVDPVFSIQGAMDATTNTITAHVDSSNQPTISITLTDSSSGDTNFILPSAVTVTGSGTSWEATVTNAAITNNVYAAISVTAQNSNGETITRSCNVGVVPIDITRTHTLAGTAQFGFGYTMNANTLKENTNIVINSVTTPVTTQPDIFAVGPAMNLSLANGITTIAPLTLSFNYPNLTNTGGLYPNSTILQSKLTICFWNAETQKWVRDKNVVHAAAGNTGATCTTTHFSIYSVIADYAKPVANDISINGPIVSAKVTDNGSGINSAWAAGGSYLKVNGTTYYCTTYDQDSDLMTFEATGLVDASDYPYVLRITDKVGNYTEYSGVLTYTKMEELSDAHNYPNPFDPDREDTTIRFILSENGNITCRIYDFNGDLVTILQRNDTWSKGLVEFKWGGTNDNGRKVANGTYFAEIQVSGSASDYAGRTVRKIIKIAVVRRQEG
ncbi:MAG: FlgD immunoglobulin-like domain containing protein [bacterium]|nr:FlgD immunoglobulin-like domain containing protein [bacterium]